MRIGHHTRFKTKRVTKAETESTKMRYNRGLRKFKLRRHRKVKNESIQELSSDFLKEKSE